ncbi:hypothetical protein B296_00052182, partial [Ensete ventricosum]
GLVVGNEGDGDGLAGKLVEVDLGEARGGGRVDAGPGGRRCHSYLQRQVTHDDPNERARIHLTLIQPDLEPPLGNVVVSGSGKMRLKRRGSGGGGGEGRWTRKKESLKGKVSSDLLSQLGQGSPGDRFNVVGPPILSKVDPPALLIGSAGESDRVLLPGEEAPIGVVVRCRM